MRPSSVMLQTGFLQRLYNLALRGEVVGTDKLGNTYMRWFEGQGEAKVERREVRWAQAQSLYDPNDIPPDWRMWLRKLRDAPPTPDEVEKTEAKAAALRGKVEAIDELERQRRVRQAVQGVHAQQPGSSPPDMSRMLQQMQDGEMQGPQKGQS